MKIFNPNDLNLTKYLFYTGKGGVGKTSIACSTAINLADNGKQVLLISTDPASNLQDIFKKDLNNKGVKIKEVPNLTVVNLDPIKAADDYKNSVIEPYRGKLPESVLENMEEQLSGSCTVEIAAFNEFSNFIADKNLANKYDFIVFDTAPTGHTLRMLQLPSAWSNFISESTHGASCLGQLSGLEDQKDLYKKAVANLANPKLTTLMLVTRPEEGPILEANRASKELKEIGINNQMLIINGLLNDYDDEISKSFYQKQKEALEIIPANLKILNTSYIPLRSYNINGIENVRSLLTDENIENGHDIVTKTDIPNLQEIINDLDVNNKKVIFTMGKGGVGKTTIASAIALGLTKKDKKVHLTTTDPANHLDNSLRKVENLTISHIDEKEELKKYQDEVLENARKTMSDEDIAYIEEDLRSPCTQEIAIFRAFADIVDKADDEVVVIDTAPTGHTLLLLDSTESYNKEIEKTGGNIPEATKKLLPRLKNDKETEVVIVTLAETTPVYESLRLEEDLNRANIFNKWWLINSSLYGTETTNEVLAGKANNEIEWINIVDKHTNGNFALIPWVPVNIKASNLENIIN